MFVIAQHGTGAVPAHVAASAFGAERALAHRVRKNGNPHRAHHGGAKKVIAAQHTGHSVSGSPTVAPHARQRGGQNAVDDDPADLPNPCR